MVRRRSLLPIALVVFGLASPGCRSVRLYAKDLMDPRASAAVTVPTKVATALFVLPPAIAWLPISVLPLLLLHDEGAVWFALAPGLIVGGPLVLIFGTPGYLLTDRPVPEDGIGGVTTATTAPVRS